MSNADRCACHPPYPCVDQCSCGCNMTTPHERTEEGIKKEYLRMWNSGEFEWNHHEGDTIGAKPINPERIWQTFIKPCFSKTRADERRKVVVVINRLVMSDEYKGDTYIDSDDIIKALSEPS